MGEDLIFSLDIGTRTVVGILLELKGDKLVLKESEVIEHKNRSMLDGQIHNVVEVAEQIEKIKTSLEEKSDVELKKVAIAAAGRALRTTKENHQLEFNKKRVITEEDIKVLEFGAVQKAQEKLFKSKDNENSKYHFVGYSVLQSRVDGIKVANLTGQKGSEIEADIIATFLPEIVVDSLLSAVNRAGLEVEHLTLEPIAASNIVVPKQMYNFNLALVDIGAGTSDIAITKEGAIIGFAMVPVAGDEITEAICEEYMVDYHSGEAIKKSLGRKEEIITKDILGQEVKLNSQEVIKRIEPKIDNLAKLIKDEILELNKKAPQAVICIGGGSLTPLFKEKLAQNFDLANNRVGIKDISDINEVEGVIKGINGTQAITPFGIGASYNNDTTETNFIDVEVNGELVNLFTLTKPKVSDALLAAGIDIKAIKARPGMAISVEVNNNLKVIKGELGEDGYILLNQTEVGLEKEIKSGDKIKVKLGKAGKPGQAIISDVVPKLPKRSIEVNGEEIELEPIYYLNGKQADDTAKLSDRAKVKYTIPQTVADVMKAILDIDAKDVKNKSISYLFNGQSREISYSNYQILLNGAKANLTAEINENDKLIIKERSAKRLTIADILAKEDYQSTLRVKFNGEAITMPIKEYKLIKNQKSATKTDLVYNGDKIKYEPSLLRLNQLLDYIDYQIPTSVKGKLIIEKNKQRAQLIEPLSEGDEIKIYTV